MAKIKVAELFYSIQGEGIELGAQRAGVPIEIAGKLDVAIPDRRDLFECCLDALGHLGPGGVELKADATESRAATIGEGAVRHLCGAHGTGHQADGRGRSAARTSRVSFASTAATRTLSRWSRRMLAKPMPMATIIRLLRLFV